MSHIALVPDITFTRIHLISWFILIIIVTGITTPTLSQVYVGLKAGQGYSNLKANDPVFIIYNDGSSTYANPHLTNGNRRGFDAGAFALIGLGNRIGLQTELRYSVKGSHALGTNHEWVLKYIEIPLLVRAATPLSMRTSLFALTGIEMGLNVSKEFRSIGGIGQPYTYELENFNKLDWGLVAGVGISYKIRRVMSQLEIRYVFGLDGIGETDNLQNVEPDIYYLSGDPWAKNRQLSILTGIAIEM